MRLSRRLILLLLICLANITLGCGRPATVAPPPSPPLPHQQSLQAKVSLDPTQPKSLDPVTFKVMLCDSHGVPAHGEIVTFRLKMTSMEMGKNEFVAHESAPGEYTGIGRFSMPGDWTVAITLQKGQESATQSFPVEVK